MLLKQERHLEHLEPLPANATATVTCCCPSVHVAVPTGPKIAVLHRPLPEPLCSFFGFYLFCFPTHSTHSDAGEMGPRVSPLDPPGVKAATEKPCSRRLSHA